MENENIKIIVFAIILVICFAGLLFESIFRHKNGKLKFLSKDHFMAYLDAAVLSYFILIKDISLLALILYFIIESIVYIIISAIMRKKLHDQLKTFFKNNAWTSSLFNHKTLLSIIALFFIALINVDSMHSFNMTGELKLPLIYLAISTFLNCFFTKNKSMLVVQNMVVAASNFLPVSIILVMLFAFKDIGKYNVYIGMFFVIAQMLINLAATQTIYKSYLNDYDKENGI